MIFEKFDIFLTESMEVQKDFYQRHQDETPNPEEKKLYFHLTKSRKFFDISIICILTKIKNT